MKPFDKKSLLSHRHQKAHFYFRIFCDSLLQLQHVDLHQLVRETRAMLQWEESNAQTNWITNTENWAMANCRFNWNASDSNSLSLVRTVPDNSREDVARFETLTLRSNSSDTIRQSQLTLRESFRCLGGLKSAFYALAQACCRQETNSSHVNHLLRLLLQMTVSDPEFYCQFHEIVLSDQSLFSREAHDTLPDLIEHPLLSLSDNKHEITWGSCLLAKLLHSCKFRDPQALSKVLGEHIFGRKWRLLHDMRLTRSILTFSGRDMCLAFAQKFFTSIGDHELDKSVVSENLQFCLKWQIFEVAFISFYTKMLESGEECFSNGFERGTLTELHQCIKLVIEEVFYSPSDAPIQLDVDIYLKHLFDFLINFVTTFDSEIWNAVLQRSYYNLETRAINTEVLCEGLVNHLKSTRGRFSQQAASPSPPSSPMLESTSTLDQEPSRKCSSTTCFHSLEQHSHLEHILDRSFTSPDTNSFDVDEDDVMMECEEREVCVADSASSRPKEEKKLSAKVNFKLVCEAQLVSTFLRILRDCWSRLLVEHPQTSVNPAVLVSPDLFIYGLITNPNQATREAALIAYDFRETFGAGDSDLTLMLFKSLLFTNSTLSATYRPLNQKLKTLCPPQMFHLVLQLYKKRRAKHEFCLLIACQTLVLTDVCTYLMEEMDRLEGDKSRKPSGKERSRTGTNRASLQDSFDDECPHNLCSVSFQELGKLLSVDAIDCGLGLVLPYWVHILETAYSWIETECPHYTHLLDSVLDQFCHFCGKFYQLMMKEMQIDLCKHLIAKMILLRGPIEMSEVRESASKKALTGQVFPLRRLYVTRGLQEMLESFYDQLRPPCKSFKTAKVEWTVNAIIDCLIFPLDANLASMPVPKVAEQRQSHNKRLTNQELREHEHALEALEYHSFNRLGQYMKNVGVTYEPCIIQRQIEGVLITLLVKFTSEFSVRRTTATNTTWQSKYLAEIKILGMLCRE
ncbi:hypothetical protein Ciccas_003452 [Cichlidogyrus casuarinus]|uniref:Uncharacterized protein n=1 Tax=Cichlidogyrus casuarinus TaxID=1844966 RepID=A0ABD2QEC6_9PLAT